MHRINGGVLRPALRSMPGDPLAASLAPDTHVRQSPSRGARAHTPVRSEMVKRTQVLNTMHRISHDSRTRRRRAERA